MFEPISVGAMVCTVAFALSRPATGYSSQSNAYDEPAEMLRYRFESSQALFGEKGAAIAAIRELLEECAEDDWDGDGASKLSPLSVQVAEDFIRALPDGFPIPEISAEASGTVSLDWISSRHRYLSITVSETGRLLYVLADGANRSRGIVVFNSGLIPSQILSNIQVIIRNEQHASFGIA